VTDASGNYSFSVAPGTYTVSEVLQAGWFQSYPDIPGDGDWDVTLTSGQNDTGNDFGNYRNATKTGQKFHDLDGDGVKDAGEGGLSGWTINLVGTTGLGVAVNTSTVTDASGNYSFSVAPGTYTVSEVLQPDWFQSYPEIPGDGDWDVTLTSGQNDTGNDFGNYQYAIKSGYKFWDKPTPGNPTPDGVWDPNGADNISGNLDDETGLQGWEIRAYADNDNSNNLSAGDTLVASDTTDANGFYQLDLAPGKYIIVEVLQTDWNQTAPGTSVNTFNTDLGEFGYVVTLTSGEVEPNNNFGNTEIPAFEGLSPGFWKTHTGAPYAPGRQANAWNPNYKPGPVSAGGTPLSSVFNTAPVGANLDGNGTVDSMLDALNFKGGSGITGAARTLLRQAVAGLLNCTQGSINYPLTKQQLESAVNAALASNNRNTMLALANQLDGYNNLHGTIELLQANKAEAIGSRQKSKSAAKDKSQVAAGATFTSELYAYESTASVAADAPIAEPTTTASLLVVSEVSPQLGLTLFSAPPTLSGSGSKDSNIMAVDSAFSSLNSSSRLLLTATGGLESEDAEESEVYDSGELATSDDVDLIGVIEDEVFAQIGDAL
jgi:hypothetical protein